MKYEIQLTSIERKLPIGCSLPAGLRQWIKNCERRARGELGWFAVKYTNPNSLIIGDARAQLLPFLRLPDGGFVAFWFRSPSKPLVVWLSSEGESEVIARSWRDFERRFADATTGVEDLDDRTSVARKPRRAKKPSSVGGERKAFRAWLKSLAPKPPKGLAGAAGEPIRAAIFKPLKRYLKEPYARETLIVDYTKRTYRVQWYAGGLKPCPVAKALRPPLTELWKLVGRALHKSELSISGDGTVFFEKNIEVGKPPRRTK